MSNKPLEQVKAILSEHYTNYAFVVLDEETDLLDYRFNNQMIGKTLFNEAVRDIESYDTDAVDVIWDDDEDE